MKRNFIFQLIVFSVLIAIPQISSSQSTTNTIENKTSNQKDILPIDPNVKVGKLDNGLTYYLRNNGKPEDKVELRLVINVGSILEDEKQLGLAHFMEHMCFNGSKNFKKNDLVDYLQSIGVKFGADLNAYTSFDETVYILPIPSDDPEKLEKGFQILEDWAHLVTLTKEGIDGERGVVLEEYRMGQGADERMLQKYLPIIAYNSKYANRLPIGTKENLENFKYEDLERFYKDWYRPDLMAVVVVGDLDITTMENKVKEHFGTMKMPKKPKKREDIDAPNHEETLIAVVSDKEAAVSLVQLMYKDIKKSKPSKTITDYRKNLIEGLFMQMMNNRLSEIRNKPNPPFIFAGNSYRKIFARNQKAYQSFALASETGQLNALKAILQENKKVQQYGFKTGEFERAKKDLIAFVEKEYKDRDKKESSAIVGEYVRNYLEEEPIPGIEWEYEYTKSQLPDINLQEVNNLIKRFLHDNNRAIVMTGPEKEGLKQVSKEEILTLLKEVENSTVEDYIDEKVRENLIEKAPTPGKIIATDKNKDMDFTVLTLSNGAKVTYKKTDFKNDEILFGAFSYGGMSLYSDQEYHKTVFANQSLSQTGLGGLSINDMNKVMSGKIVSLRPFIRNLSEGFNGVSTPKDLETLFQQIYLYFTGLNKDPEAWKSDMEKQKGYLANLLANPQTYFNIEFGKFQNQGNPRYSGFPTAEKLDAADYNLAYSKYKERFAGAGGFNFYFIGNIDEQKLKSYTEKYLASLPEDGKGEMYKVSDFRPLAGSHKKIVHKGKDPKSTVNIIWNGETKYIKEENLAFKGLSEILSIKLVEKLREEESGVYGVGANGSIGKLPYGNYRFTIRFPCGPENVEKLTKSAVEEVTKIIKNGPTDKDLSKIKEARLLDFKERKKQNKFWLNTLQNSDFEQESLKNLDDYIKRVNTLSKEDIQKVAKKYLDKGYILGVLMPEK